MKSKSFRIMKHVIALGPIAVLALSLVGGLFFATDGGWLQVSEILLTIFGLASAVLSAVLFMLYLYKPLIYKKLKGELGWGRRDTEEGVYPLLEGVEANHCALIAPLSAKNDVARFLIDHGLKPQCTELLFSPQTAVDPTFSPVVVFGLASRLPSGDSRFVKDVGSIDDDPVDFYDFEKLYRHCCTKIATLKEDFSPVDIFVDTTAGTAVVSMACLHAAMHEGVNAIYVKGTMPNPKAGGPPLVVADNPKSGSIILVHNVRTETVS